MCVVRVALPSMVNGAKVLRSVVVQSLARPLMPLFAFDNGFPWKQTCGRLKMLCGMPKIKWLAAWRCFTSWREESSTRKPHWRLMASKRPTNGSQKPTRKSCDVPTATSFSWASFGRDRQREPFPSAPMLMLWCTTRPTAKASSAPTAAWIYTASVSSLSPHAAPRVT